MSRYILTLITLALFGCSSESGNSKAHFQNPEESRTEFIGNVHQLNSSELAMIDKLNDDLITISRIQSLSTVEQFDSTIGVIQSTRYEGNEKDILYPRI